MVSPSPSVDFDDLSDEDILDLAERVKEGWAERDAVIEEVRQLRRQLWKPEIPDAWKQTAKVQQTALAREIPQRVVGTLTLREPVFSRLAPDDDWESGERANRVERFFQGKFVWDRRKALPGKDAYVFQTDQLTNKGAACVGSLYAPNAWAGAPLFLDEDGEKPSLRWWRDSMGKETDSLSAMDWEASGRAFLRGVDAHRQRSGCVLQRRIVPTETAYPLIIEGKLLALFIFRSSSMMEVASRGFLLDTGRETNTLMRPGDFLEVHTANRSRFYWNRTKVRLGRAVGKDQPESDGTLAHMCGFVPYAYRVGLDGGELEWGEMGMPLLSLIASNLKTIITLRTYLLNAVHLASFTSFWLEYVGDQTAAVVDARTNKRLSTFDFKSGTIMDFGPGRKVNPFIHPGLNNDFYQLLSAEREEVDRIVPRTLVGMAESSGFNTVQSSTQARAIFNSITSAQEFLEADLAGMDMQHLNRHPGPVYVGVEEQGYGGRKKLSRVRVEARDLEDFYEISVGIDRTMDHITEGQWAANLLQAGIGDKEWAAGKAGIVDYQDMVKRQARDRFLDTAEVQQIITQEAIRVYGLEAAAERAAAMQTIQTAPDGSPLVQTSLGYVAGPGASPTSPMGAGIAQGATNVGQPNLASAANPSIALPAPTETGRSRMRRRGGAIPGAPQRPRNRPEPQNAAA